MVDQGLTLRRSLQILDSTRGSFYYYKPTCLARRDKRTLRDPSILTIIRELSLEHPTYGTRTMAVSYTDVDVNLAAVLCELTQQSRDVKFATIFL